jgi:hypothetical protein
VVRGLVSLFVTGIAVMHIETTMPSVLMLGALYLITAGLSYMTSPLMSVLGERDLLLSRGSQADYNIVRSASRPSLVMAMESKTVQASGPWRPAIYRKHLPNKSERPGVSK